MNNSEQIEMLLKANPRELAEIEEWATRLHSLGYSFLIPIAGRTQFSVSMYGHKYHLIAVHDGRLSARWPLPSFMGYEGFALRKVTKL
jgi:hypothetical protein